MKPQQFKKGRKAHNRKRVVHDGIEYESSHEMAVRFRTSPSLIRYYLRTDKPFCGECIDYL